MVDENGLPHMKGCKDRHMALVLDGPSRFGKTTFCKQLVQDESQYLEINCLNLTSPPNLRMISPETRLICFDEATVRWCLDNKTMLQGPEMALTMGDSQTGCHSYTVELNGIMTVVSSNSCSEELSVAGSFSESEKDYLSKNFIHVYVDRPLWQEGS